MTENVVYKEFAEFTPDLAQLGTNGLLEANNVLPDVDGYTPYTPLVSLAATLPGTARGMFLALGGTVPSFYQYAATSTLLFMGAAGGGSFSTKSAALATSTSNDWAFAQYDTLVFACNHDNTMYHTIGSSSSFITANAPKAALVAVVGQFVVLGDLRESPDRPSAIRWSAIDDPTNFPTPNSATAIATQAGEQVLNTSFGEIQSIEGGDQHALIFQQFGITRMTYVGPPVVFQFDEISSSKGATYKFGVVKAVHNYHFHSVDGFYVTDGVSITNTGLGKIDKAVKESISGSSTIRGTFCQRKKCIFWSFFEIGQTMPNKLYAFHVDTGKWTRADQSLTMVDKSDMSSVTGPHAFSATNIYSYWPDATAGGAYGTALLTTAELEANPGGRAFLSGVKPHIESSGTAPAITVRIGSRNDLTTTPSYSATASPSSRTGFVDCRVDAKYHRAEVQIVGNFARATGLEFKAVESGSS